MTRKTKTDKPRLEEILQAFHLRTISLFSALTRSGLKERTFFRRLKHWREGGSLALLHKNTGKIPHNKMSAEQKDQIISLIVNKYWDFGPQLLSETLAEQEEIHISRETARRLIGEAFPHKTRTKRTQTEHPLRRRRSAFGELIQIDGSPHDWFNTGEISSCLIAFIDDATNRITAARFFKAEEFQGYSLVLQEHVRRYGIPIALYSDRHSVFTARYERRNLEKQSETQFTRMCRMLGIELILAQSPHAKGRVERTFKTLQNRWPQLFRVHGITNIEEANMRIGEFIENYNQKFAISPRNEVDAHVILTEDDLQGLERIGAYWLERIISSSLTVSVDRKTLQIYGVGTERAVIAKSRCYVIQYFNGDLEILWKNRNGEEVLLNFKQSDRAKVLQPKVLEATPKMVDATVNELTRNSWVQRHHRERRQAEEKKLARQQRAEATKALERKLAERHGPETAAKIVGSKKN